MNSKNLLISLIVAVIAVGISGCGSKEDGELVTGPVKTRGPGEPGPSDSASGAGGGGAADNAPATMSIGP